MHSMEVLMLPDYLLWLLLSCKRRWLILLQPILLQLLLRCRPSRW